MPIVEVKAFASRFEDEAVSAQVIAKLTDALCEVFGEGIRDETWVVLHGIPKDQWGFGGEVRP